MIVVEHDREVIENSDAVCDFGPKAGTGGGEIIANGSPEEVSKSKASVTGPYMSRKKAIPIPSNRRPALSLDMPLKKQAKKKAKKKATKKKAKKKAVKKKAMPKTQLATTLDVVGARHNNLKDIEVKFPLESLTVVTGPSGCGKSSLVNDILFKALSRRLHRSTQTPGAHKGIRGIENVNKVIRVDQTPLGNSPSSNPATYTGAFDAIRELFAHLPDSKIRGFTARRFSFNVPGGRCEECFGNGQTCIEMHFLPDVWVPCETCKGRRYNDETLAVRYEGKSIDDVLKMSCGEAVKLFHNIPKIRRILQTLCDVGLDYVTLGQSAPTLSGGEAQRVKLSAELARPDTGRTMYLLDEPTTGLHFDDLQKLLDVIQRLVDIGNTVVLIEHNLDLIKAADWVIDLGPEAGAGGGQIVVQGTPEMVVEYAQDALAAASKSGKSKAGMPRSWTGEALVEVLESDPYKERKVYDPDKDDRWKKGDMDIEDVGANAKMPWEADGRLWHTQDRVGRLGEPVNWEGQILSKVVDYIQQHVGFKETDWNDRAVVEILGTKKSQGWFFHTLTGDPWFLKMKFRVRPKTFSRDDLVQQIPLLRPNDLEDIPVYGNTPRVKLTNAKASWQEIEIRVNNLVEIDIPGFWSFLDEAIDSFLNKKKVASKSKKSKIEDESPWAKLGSKWHFMRKGFAPGKKIKWKPEVLEILHDVIQKAAPEGQFLWSNKQVVHVYLPQQKHPWVSIQTKKPDGVWLQVAGPKDSVEVERVVDIGDAPTVSTKEDLDVLQMSFNDVEQVSNQELADFLVEHAKSLPA